VKTLLRMINGEPVETTLQVLSPKLVVRESTAKARINAGK
jgi:DNA-binding LacI/PurR family transcriptional regulator